MPTRLVAVDDGPDIMLDRALVVVGRHPACDTRLDSLRVSRQHCCMVQENGEVVVRDLGSTNGIRINGQRVEIGRLKVGDELSIAHIRFRLENGKVHEQTIADSGGLSIARRSSEEHAMAIPIRVEDHPAIAPVLASSEVSETAFAAAVRKLLPVGMADNCRIQVIVQMAGDGAGGQPEPEPAPVGRSMESENGDACRSDSSH